MLLHCNDIFNELPGNFDFCFVGFSVKMDLQNYEVLQIVSSFNLGLDDLIENTSVRDDDITVHLDGIGKENVCRNATHAAEVKQFLDAKTTTHWIPFPWRNNVHPLHIMQLSGHKNIESLNQ